MEADSVTNKIHKADVSSEYRRPYSRHDSSTDTFTAIVAVLYWSKVHQSRWVRLHVKHAQPYEINRQSSMSDFNKWCDSFLHKTFYFFIDDSSHKNFKELGKRLGCFRVEAFRDMEHARRDVRRLHSRVRDQSSAVHHLTSKDLFSHSKY